MQVRKGDSKFFTFVKRIVSLFVKKPKVINQNGILDKNAIYISNHVFSLAPIKHELYFPHTFKFWGTHEMALNYKDRWNYLANEYFYTKHGNKFLAVLLATLSLPFVTVFYKGIKLIPTYSSGKMLKTIKDSTEYLKKGRSIIIFPENAKDGYKDKLTEYFAGFLTLAKYYYKQTNHNIKIYNMYFRRQDNTLIIDKPITIQEILDDGRDMKEIANEFKDKANLLATVQKPEVVAA